jgi:hypothetical protein
LPFDAQEVTTPAGCVTIGKKLAAKVRVHFLYSVCWLFDRTLGTLRRNDHSMVSS